MSDGVYGERIPNESLVLKENRYVILDQDKDRLRGKLNLSIIKRKFLVRGWDFGFWVTHFD